jgi:molybdopterin converting factor small subunit
MSVRIEFYGIPRRRAGVEAVEIEAGTLEQALAALSRELPEFARTCVAHNRLKAGYLANLNGRFFTTDPQATLQPGDCVLILSADVGG